MLYELPEFEYFEPESVSEALGVLQRYGGTAKVLAGGTDLLGLMKDRIKGSQMPLPAALVNIKRIKELHELTNGDEESVLGSCLTLTEISSNGVLQERFPALTQAAGVVGTNQIRNMGTLGGNLCQRPWCWYFRHPAFDCFKKGGKQCYAITGDNSTYFSVYDRGVCVMAHPSDTAPALIALGAVANISGPGGEKEVPLNDFFLGPRSVNDNILQPDEVLAHVTIPLIKGQRSVYLKQRTRNNWDFALASVAASATVEDGSVVAAKVVLGGVAPRPHVLEGVAEEAEGGLTEEARARITELVERDAKPLRLNKYKVRMTRSLVLRALEAVLDQRPPKR